MHAGIDHQSDGAKHLGLKPTEIAERILIVKTHIGFGDAFGVQRPSFRIGIEWQYFT